jgi:hypothetical protein
VDILYKKNKKLAIAVLKLLGIFYKKIQVPHWSTGEPTEVSVYTNPTIEDVKEIKKSYAFPKNILPNVRFLADKNQKRVFIWHGEIGAYHQDMEKALHISPNTGLRGIALILPNNMLKVIETSGIQKNLNDWVWVSKYMKDFVKVMTRNV